MRTRSSAVAILIALFAAPALADVRPAALFGDHAVLQRGVPVPVWGTANPGDVVQVTFGDQRVETRAEADGRWQVTLAPLVAQTAPAVLTIAGPSNTVQARDVLVGEVWVCSGQSNMTFALNRATDAGREIANASVPSVRLFDVPRIPSATPAADVRAEWRHCTPETASTFSAVAYFLARDLSASLGVPVGVIHSSWGGTVAQNWSPRKVLEDERFSKVLEREAARAATLPARTEWESAIARWEALPAAERAATSRPAEPPLPSSKGGPSHLYNGMIAPLIPYAVRGVVWYQGESNRTGTSHYRELLPEMIRGWRGAWGQPQLPFVIIQIANYLPRSNDPNERSVWAEIREVQRITAAAIPDAALVVTIDVGDAEDLHPKNKQDVGHRAALAARRVAYGESIVAGGPAMRDVRFEGGRAVVSFTDLGGGLVARGEGPLAGFAIAGADRRFMPAEAQIEGDLVVLRSAAVPAPVAVRYGWADNPTASLFNREGLPAGPFRSDDWPWSGPVPIKP